MCSNLEELRLRELVVIEVILSSEMTPCEDLPLASFLSYRRAPRTEIFRL